MELESFSHKPRELERLQMEHDEKTKRIEELKSQIQNIKRELEKNKKGENNHKKEIFMGLTQTYNQLKQELDNM
ncbi:unnamed protein product [Amaranthus hypochondriacus]